MGAARQRRHTGVMVKKTPAGTELQSFRTLASFRLHVLARLSERMHELQYKRMFGLNLRECRIIGITGGHGESSFRRIHEESNLDRAQVSRLINRLVKRGLLRKENDPADQRSVKVMLTERGRTVHRALHAAATELNEEWLAPLSAADNAKFLALLDVLTDRARRVTDSRHAAAAKGRPRTPVLLRKRPAETALPGEVVLDQKTASQFLDMLKSALKKRA
jgi:DNA-binding MarR family transcriptional regulator